MKLLIGIPTAGSPAVPFLQSLAALRMPEQISAADRCLVSGNFVPAQRELMVRRARELGADLIAMIDDDMVVEPDALERLCATVLRDDGVALAGALYYSRDGLRPMAVAGWSADRTTAGYTPAFDGVNPVDVDGVGFGCVVLRASALTSIPEPFFRAQIFIEETAKRVRVCNEDYLFCAVLREAGFRVVLHSGVKCGHFDRSSGRTLPEEWESPEQTDHPRMMVTRAGGAPELIALDLSVAQAPERHASLTLDYIFS